MERHVFAVEIWGDVATWVGAIGTGGAAVTAVTFYIADARAKRATQARLISATSRQQNLQLSIQIKNRSDHPITDINVWYREKKLAESLLSRDIFHIQRMAYNTQDKQIVKMIEHTSSPLKKVKAKEEFLGYDGRKGMILAWPNLVVSPGGEASIDIQDHEYRVSTVYWLGFKDAHGFSWSREVVGGIGNDPGRLRKESGAYAIFRVSPFKNLWQKTRHYAEVLVWLTRHRKEGTSNEAQLAAIHQRQSDVLTRKYCLPNSAAETTTLNPDAPRNDGRTYDEE